MNQTISLGPEYDQRMLQALFDALTADGAQTIEQRADTAGPQETGYWKFQLEGGTLEVTAETYLELSLSGSVEFVKHLTPIIQNKILAAFPRGE